MSSIYRYVVTDTHAIPTETQNEYINCRGFQQSRKSHKIALHLISNG